MVESANGGCKWWKHSRFFGWKVFSSSVFLGPFFRLKLQTQSSRGWVDYQPTWTSITHIPSPIPCLNWSWDVAWERGSRNLFYPYLKLISTTLITSIRFLSKWRLLDSRSYTTDIICWVHWCSLCRDFLLLLIWMIVPPYLVQLDLYRRQTCSSKNGDLVFQLCPFLTKHIWGYLVFHLARCLVPNPVLDFLEKPMSTHKLFLSSANQRSCSYEELDSCISCASTNIVALGWCSQKDPHKHPQTVLMSGILWGWQSYSNISWHGQWILIIRFMRYTQA